MDNSIDNSSNNLTSNSKLSKKLAELRKWQLREEENLKRLQEETSKLNDVINSNYADGDIVSTEDTENSIENFRTDNNRQNLTPILEKCDETTVSLEVSDITEENSTLVNIDDLPVTPGIDGKHIKSFEELLKKSVETDEISISTNEKPKWPYLKKGTGLKKYQPSCVSKRFTRNCSKRNASQNKVNTSENVKIHQYFMNDLLTTETEGKTEKKSEGIESKIKSNNIKNLIYPCRADTKAATRKITFDTKIEKNDFQKSTFTKDKLKFKQSKIGEKVEEKMNCKLDAVVNSRYASKPIAIVEKHIHPENSYNAILDNESETRVDYLRRLLELIRAKKFQLIEESRKKRENILLNKDDKSEEPVQNIESKMTGLLKEKETINRHEKLDYVERLGEKLTPHLSMPRQNCYTRSLKSKIDTLEERLKNLQLKCYERKLNLKKEQDKIFSPENLMKEIVNIKEQLTSVNNELQTLQLMAAQSNIKPHRKSEVKTIVLKNKDDKATKDSEQTNEIESNEKCTNNVNNADESSITFENGDRIRRTKDNKIIYEYANGSRQITYPDGLRVVESLNGKVEIIHTNGIKHIYYPNHSQKILHPGVADQTVFYNLHKNFIPQRKLDQNCEREIRTSEFKKKVYVDGTVKIIYNDGIQEIRYPNGRRKIKNPQGLILLDAMS